MEKKSVGLLELETAVLECFSEKTPLSPLGVNKGSSIVISKFLHYTILVTISGKSFFPNNFNLKLTRFEHGVNLG
jgi:hypothetical protein